MKPIRPAGLNERRCISRDVLGVYGNLVVRATYHIDCVLGPAALHGHINGALRQCITEHPVLRAVILDAETERPGIVQPSSLDLNEHIRFLDPTLASEDDMEVLRGLLDQAHNESLDEWHVRPAWRVYVLLTKASSTSRALQLHVAFTYSHALADGFSGVLFHKSLLRALNTTQNPPFDDEPVFEVPVEASQLLPSLEQAATLSISWSFLLRPLFGEFLPSWLVKAIGMSSETPVDVWTGAQKRSTLPAPPQLLRTAICFRLIPQAHLDRALAAGRSHGARLTGLLAVVVARALANALQVRGQVTSDYIASLPLDLRRCIPEANHSMANYVSATSETINISSSQQQQHHGPTSSRALTEEDWKTARRLTERLSEASSTLADQPVALLKYLSNFRDWTLRQVAKPANGSFEVSNVGVFDSATSPKSSPSQTTRPKWTLHNMMFSQSANALGDPFNVNVASTKGGPLAVVLTWWPGMLGVEDEEMLMEEICEGLVEQMAHI